MVGLHVPRIARSSTARRLAPLCTLLTAAVIVLVWRSSLLTSPGRAQSSPPTAITGLVHRALKFPVVDDTRHRVYGVDGHHVLSLDEVTGKVTTLTTLGGRSQPFFLGLDVQNNHLMVEELHVDALYRNRATPATSHALVIDAVTGGVISRVRISHLAGVGFPWQGEVAVDSSLHHGFVVDDRGNGVMVDTTSGALLARFRTGDPSSTFGQRNTAVLDEARHRLFLGLAGDGARKSKRERSVVEVLSTVTAHVVHWVPDGAVAGPVSALALDGPAGRVFVLGISGSVVMMDSQSGVVLKRQYRYGSTYGAFGLDIAANPAAGRVFTLRAPWSVNSLSRIFEVLGVLNGATCQVLHAGPTISHFGPGGGKAHMAIDPALGRLFIDDERHLGLYVVDESSLKVTKMRLPKGVWQGYGVVVDTVTHRVFTSGPSGVAVLDTRAGQSSKHLRART